jgi:beta-glucosidase
MYQFAKDSPLMNKDFLFGTATSSFQIEGGHDLGGRSPSIWDDFCQIKGRVKHGDDGRLGIDFYHRWRDDLALIHDLQFDAYRFSLSWSRIMPNPGQVNEEGLRFYEDTIDYLNDHGIKPFLTLYHWDLPSYLETKGGWQNRETAYAFAEYAQLIAKRLGPKVRSIATLNEPFCSAFLGYLWGVHAPGYRDRRMAFQAAHHLMLAHGLAMQELKLWSPNTENGVVINFTPAYPASQKPEDLAATELADEEHNFWFTDALFLGRYPEKLSRLQPDCRPAMMPDDLELIQQPVDFLGVNYYTRQLVKAGPENELYQSLPAQEPKTDIGWEVYSDGLYDLIHQKLARYDKVPPIYITENGAAYNEGPENGEVNDDRRVEYFQGHLTQVDRLIRNGHDIRGYFAWSLLDNFEWAEGYSQRFGIVHVDYETMQRTVKKSGHYFKSFLSARGEQ